MHPDDYYAETLRCARNKAHMTQAELAAAIGVTLVSVYQWERGAARPMIGSRRKLAEMFGDVRLLEGNEPPKRRGRKVKHG